MEGRYGISACDSFLPGMSTSSTNKQPGQASLSPQDVPIILQEKTAIWATTTSVAQQQCLQLPAMLSAPVSQ